MLVSRPLRPGLVLVDVELMLRRGWGEENSRGWAYMSRSGEKSESSWNHRFIVTCRLVAALDAHAMRYYVRVHRV